MIKKKNLKLIALFLTALILLTSCVSLNPPDTSTAFSEAQSSETQSMISQPLTVSIEESQESESGAEANAFEAEIDSEFAIVYDASSNRVLFKKNSDEKCYPASLTKIMTSIIALDNLDPDELFTVGTELSLVNKGSSIAFLAKGHKLTLEMLIEALLLPSGNDAAYTVAVGTYKKVMGNNGVSDEEAVAGFCEMMNEKARELGAVNTNFVNPDGWHEDDHYTTAYDMLLISKYAMSIPLIAEIASTEKITEIFVSGQVAVWKNSNMLIVRSDESFSNDYYNEYAKGLKTGSTPEAGFCLSSYAEFGDVEIFTIVMNSSGQNKRFEDANKLFDLALSVSD
ncbi:MAG: D-alanyl-D-alanine carboxypeptidase [Eubacteriales bacterium]|nr:D-alanyl-D-alanine carboxypeptidase [Eubacteriales bacterium]